MEKGDGKKVIDANVIMNDTVIGNETKKEVVCLIRKFILCAFTIYYSNILAERNIASDFIVNMLCVGLTIAIIKLLFDTNRVGRLYNNLKYVANNCSVEKHIVENVKRFDGLKEGSGLVQFEGIRGIKDLFFVNDIDDYTVGEEAFAIMADSVDGKVALAALSCKKYKL